jgi:hypothetical protein
MKCPKCGFQQPDSRIDCEYCGLVFAKWKAKQESAQKAAEAKPLETPMPSAKSDKEHINQPIPDKEEGPVGPFPNPQRIFELLGSLYLQRNSGGVWLYFPWGVFGRGYAVEDPEVLGRIQRLETIFSLFQSSLLSSLGLAAYSVHVYQLEGSNPWFWILILVLGLAYGLFARQSGRLTADLPLTRRRFNDKQYLRRFFSCFTPSSLLSLEAASLLLALAGIWAASSNNLFLMVGESAGFLGWLWIGFSLAGFILASYLFYFQKPGRP